MSQQVGRNDPCPCGSGKKYKKCCADKAPPRPATPQVELNQLIGLFHAGRYPEVEGQAYVLLARHPDLGVVWKILGTVLGIQGKNALPALQKAAQLMPQDAEVQNNLGNMYKRLGQFEAALECYRKALLISPEDAETLNNAGVALKGVGQLEAARASYAQALRINPKFAEAHYNLGNALQEMGQSREAADCYRQAIACRPHYAVSQYNLGKTLQKLQELDAAKQAYQNAINIRPDYAEAHNNLGNVLKDLGQIDAALVSYRRALEVQPDYLDAHSNLLFALNYTADHASAMCIDEARRYGRMVTQKAVGRFTGWNCEANPERLRVGIVSGDLCKHPVAYALEGLLAQLDTNRIELIAYSSNERVDEVSARLQRHFTAWRAIYDQDVATTACQIHAEGVHILLDLSGHTAHNRLPVFAWKPAPVQVSWLGYFATTGVAEMDYLLTSEVAVPEKLQGQFTETIQYLPDIWLCFTPPAQVMLVNALPALDKGRLTFGCFQRLDKIGDAVLRAWGEILESCPGSRLLLANKELGNQDMVAKFAQRLQQQGVDQARVDCAGSASTREDYLMRYHSVDIMLDTFPYPGVTTTCEALWMGVPTLTLAGETLLSRQGAGVVVAAGLADWVADSAAGYVEKAVQFSKAIPMLARLRARLRQQVLASPVYDAPRFARNFENALWDMWREWGVEKCQKAPI